MAIRIFSVFAILFAFVTMAVAEEMTPQAPVQTVKFSFFKMANGQPAPYADVVGVLVQEKNQPVDIKSDKDGLAECKNLPEGDYEIIVENEVTGQFGSERITVAYNDEGVAEFKFVLSNDGLVRLPNDLTTVRGQDLFDTPAEKTATKDAVKVEPAKAVSNEPMTIPRQPLSTANSPYGMTNPGMGMTGAAGIGGAGIGIAGGIAGLVCGVVGIATNNDEPIVVSP